MVEPYLYFNGTCAQAVDFYETVFSGTDKQVMRFKDAPPNPQFPMPEPLLELVMHAEMTIEETRFSFGDNPDGVVAGDQTTLIVRTTNPENVANWFNQLADGGVVRMPLGPQFYARMYAWVIDRFGIHWQLIAE